MIDPNDPDEYDECDAGRVVGITAAPPGWWAVYKDPEGEFRCPVAAWIVTESSIRSSRNGNIIRFANTHAVDPTGDGWWGETVGDNGQVEYAYDPTPETLNKYMKKVG